MVLEKRFFRRVMSYFATGVAVVTTNHEGTLAGLTVNACCSVSLQPLLVLVCVDLSSSVLPHIRASGAFAINMLAGHQQQLSRCFATHSRERYEEFCCVKYSIAATGAPVLDGTLAFIDARVVAEYPGGDHAIVLGQVEAIGAECFTASPENTGSLSTRGQNEQQENMTPLLYFRGEYCSFTQNTVKPGISSIELSE